MSDLSTKFIFSLDANKYTLNNPSSIEDIENNYTINQTSGYLVENDGRIGSVYGNYVQRPNTGTIDTMGIAGKGATTAFNRHDYGVITTVSQPSTTTSTRKTVFLVVTPNRDTSNGNNPGGGGSQHGDAYIFGNYGVHGNPNKQFGHNPVGGSSSPSVISGYNSKDFQIYQTTTDPVGGSNRDEIIETVPTTTYDSQTVYYPTVITFDYVDSSGNPSNSKVIAYYKTYNSSGNTGVLGIHSNVENKMEIDSIAGSGFVGTSNAFYGRLYALLVADNLTNAERSSIETSLYNRYVEPVVNFNINFAMATTNALSSTSNLLSWIGDQSEWNGSNYITATAANGLDARRVNTDDANDFNRIRVQNVVNGGVINLREIQVWWRNPNNGNISNIARHGTVTAFSEKGAPRTSDKINDGTNTMYHSKDTSGFMTTNEFIQIAWSGPPESGTGSYYVQDIVEIVVFNRNDHSTHYHDRYNDQKISLYNSAGTEIMYWNNNTDSLGIPAAPSTSNAHIIVYQNPNRSETTDSEWRTTGSGLHPSSSSKVRKAGGNDSDVTVPSSWDWPSKGSALEFWRSNAPDGYIDLEFSVGGELDITWGRGPHEGSVHLQKISGGTTSTLRSITDSNWTSSHTSNRATNSDISISSGDKIRVTEEQGSEYSIARLYNLEFIGNQGPPTITIAAGYGTATSYVLDGGNTSASTSNFAVSIARTSTNVYTENNATATDSSGNSLSVTKGGDTVDSSVAGTYTVTFEATDSNGQVRNRQKVITIVDNSLPIITINAGYGTATRFSGWDGTASTANVVITLDQSSSNEYIEKGITITDEGADGEPESLTYSNASVSITVNGTTLVSSGSYHALYSQRLGTVTTANVGSSLITYTASDIAGNQSIRTKTVNVVDRIGPVITLNGTSVTYVMSDSTVGAVYDDPGIVAKDYAGPGMTLSEELSKGSNPGWTTDSATSVDMDVDGEYTVTYTATDQYGNQTTATRTVNITSTGIPGDIKIRKDSIRRVFNTVCQAYVKFDENANLITYTREDVAGFKLQNNGRLAVGKDDPTVLFHASVCKFEDDFTVDSIILSDSDKRLKIKIEDITVPEAGKIHELEPMQYNWKVNPDGSVHFGFIAQDIVEHYPDLVKIDDEGGYSLDYIGFIPLIIKELKRQMDEIDDLTQEAAHLRELLDAEIKKYNDINKG